MSTDPLQKLKSTVNRGITTISVKTSSSLEKNKIRTHIDSLEKEIERLLLTAGQDAFALWEAGSDGLDDLVPTLTQVKQKREEITQLTASLDAIDERDDAILGRTPEEAPPPPAPVQRYRCTKCGEIYDELPNFCRGCGSRLK